MTIFTGFYQQSQTKLNIFNNTNEAGIMQNCPFMFSQLFPGSQAVDSAQQDAFLRAVGIAEPEQWDSITTH